LSETPSSTQSEFVANLSPGRRSFTAPTARPDGFKNKPFQNRSLVVKLDALNTLDKVRPIAFARYLIAFFVGVAVTLGWQLYGGAVQEVIAPTLSSPYQQQLTAMSLDIDAVRQNVDRMMTGFAVGQNQMTRSINQLRVGQDWMASDFAAKLKAVEQDVIDRISTPAPRPASPPVSKPALRPPHIAATR
jgi:hypothetical protein